MSSSDRIGFVPQNLLQETLRNARHDPGVTRLMKAPPLRIGSWSSLLLGLVLLPMGCTQKHHRQWADRETYGIIASKSPLVSNMDPAFTIEQTNLVSLEYLPTVETVPEFLGEAIETEHHTRVLSLETALETGVRHSRIYQNSKEQLYLTALGLSQFRHDFTPILSAGGRGSYAVDTEQVVAFEPDPDNPGATKPVLSDELVERNRVSASGTVRADWLLRDVGRITTAFTTDFLRFLTGDPRTVTSSQLGATFARPMLRNAGFKREKESLTQAERNMLYQLREFSRFRKDFSVQIATTYYSVLSSRDAVRNSYLNLQSSRSNGERTRALAAEGRTTQSDLGRIEQQELSAESAWINALRSYRQSLDNFKIQLGLPMDADLVLDDRELDQLRIDHPDIAVDQAIQIAHAARLDYLNLYDRVEDAHRRVDLAVDGFKPQVDVVASGSIRSEEQSSGFAIPDPDRYRWNAGLDFDLGLDQKPRRNAYRESLIALEQARRAFELRHDEIELEIHESWRTLEEARRNYEISEISVDLAERRVEEQDLLADLGRAKAQDQVDAQNALVDSKNQRTQALVRHTIARLQFWNNMGILYIKDNGHWEELSHVQPR
jgi:outer membrane protein TolC